METIIGIDLGTTNSAAAHVDNTGPKLIPNGLGEVLTPSVVGIDAWPMIPRGMEWKAGVCQALGLGDPPAAWRRILSSVKTYADLQPALVGAVERLIDFVTDPT